MRYTLLAVLTLASCGPLPVRTAHTSDGTPIDIAFLIQNPLCIFLCPTTVSSTGSNVDSTGGNVSNTQTSSTTGGALTSN
jgi:hypothetical protein